MEELAYCLMLDAHEMRSFDVCSVAILMAILLLPNFSSESINTSRIFASFERKCGALNVKYRFREETGRG